MSGPDQRRHPGAGRATQQLVTLLNRLFDAITEGKGEEQSVKEIMNELLQYTIIHFAMEESLFRIFEYPDCEEHRKHHQSLRNQAHETNQKIQSEEKGRLRSYTAFK